jgi:hypothetical protein
MPDTGIDFGLLIRAGSAKRVADSETATYKLDVTNGVTHRTPPSVSTNTRRTTLPTTRLNFATTRLSRR